MAHGQAMISTATAFTSAKLRAGLEAEHQPDQEGEGGRRHHGRDEPAVIRSTSAWIGSFAPCACSTMRMIPASTVSAPTSWPGR